jgi:uncharacterized membrane protein
MSDESVQLIIAAFNDESGAEEALKQLKASKKKLTGIQAALAMHKDATGKKMHYKEVGMTPGKGALGGVILGATLGILSGGTGLVLGAAGALLGSLVGEKKQEGRFSADRINQVAASLPPGSSAIGAVVEDHSVAELEKELAALGADLLIIPISANIAEQLKEHRDAAYAALTRELGPGTDHTAAGDEAD